MNVSIRWLYQTPRNQETRFESAEMPLERALLFIEDMERTGRMKQVELIDGRGAAWTVKEAKRYIKEVEVEPHNVRIYFDGGYKRETSEAGLGCVIYYEQNGKSYRLRQNAFVEGFASNNEAEFAALHLALQELEFLGARGIPVEIRGDSQVVLQHMIEDWEIMDPTLASWGRRVDQKIDKLKLQPEYHKIPRHKNNEANRLATQALKGIPVAAEIEIVS